MSTKKTLWTYDCETDPFKYGDPPTPFLWVAISEDGDRVIYWGDDSTEKFMAWIESLDNALLLAHNGGRFDSLFIKQILSGAMLIVGGRIIKCNVKKSVEIRDSFAILPMALAKIKTTAGSKLEIDFKKLRRENRQKYKAEIIRYCAQDCMTLLAAVQNFYEKAGSRKLTIASAASTELRKIYPELPKLTAEHYDEFSPYFFGGRVQAFQKGIIEGNFKLYDVNSMYPAVMASEYHPCGASYNVRDYHARHIPENCAGFFWGTLDTNGAVPVRKKNKTTPYEIAKNADVKITIHELKAALDCKLVKNIRGKLIIPNNVTRFDKFILPHFESRKRARAVGDDGGDLYHKLIPNSSYGRFAMSPDGREEIYYAAKNEDLTPLKIQGWGIDDIDLQAERYILKRAVVRPWLFYEDVATGASITGAARARLMRGIHSAKNVLYCDTDSIMCEEFAGKISDELGDWKIEAKFDTAAIAGKKMYTLLQNKRPIKSASKGVRACPTEIYMAADGDEVEIFSDAPIMRLNSIKFMSRTIKRT